MSDKKSYDEKSAFSPVVIVAALTAFNLIICLVLILAGTESETAQQFISACADMAKIGFGGLVALIATRGRRNV